MIDQLQASDFKHLEGAAFPIRFHPEVTLEAELIEVAELNTYSPLARKPFVLVFRTGQLKDYFPQAVYTVIHPDKGELDLFLVPLGRDEKGTKYEASFG